MSSQDFSGAAVGGGDSSAQGGSEKSQPPPPYNPTPTTYGYDQPADAGVPKGPSAGPPPATSYGYNQPGDRDPVPPYGFSPHGNVYGQPTVPGPYTAQPPPMFNNNTTVVVNNTPGLIVAPLRENTPPPDTGCTLVLSILVLIFCAWPCGIGAIVANRRARTLVDLGQHTAARGALSRMWVWIFVSILFGIGAWIYIGFRIKAAMEEVDELEHENYYG